MNDVDNRFDKQFNFTVGATFTDSEKFDGLILGEELKAFIHQELRNQAEEIIDSIQVSPSGLTPSTDRRKDYWDGFDQCAENVTQTIKQLRQQYLSETPPAKPK